MILFGILNNLITDKSASIALINIRRFHVNSRLAIAAQLVSILVIH